MRVLIIIVSGKFINYLVEQNNGRVAMCARWPTEQSNQQTAPLCRKVGASCVWTLTWTRPGELVAAFASARDTDRCARASEKCNLYLVLSAALLAVSVNLRIAAITIELALRRSCPLSKCAPNCVMIMRCMISAAWHQQSDT